MAINRSQVSFVLKFQKKSTWIDLSKKKGLNKWKKKKKTRGEGVWASPDPRTLTCQSLCNSSPLSVYLQEAWYPPCPDGYQQPGWSPLICKPHRSCSSPLIPKTIFFTGLTETNDQAWINNWVKGTTFPCLQSLELAKSEGVEKDGRDQSKRKEGANCPVENRALCPVVDSHGEIAAVACEAIWRLPGFLQTATSEGYARYDPHGDHDGVLRDTEDQDADLEAVVLI